MKTALLVLPIFITLVSPVDAGMPTSWATTHAVAVEVKGDGLDRTCTVVNVLRTTESGVPVTEITLHGFVTLQLDVHGLWGCSDRAWLFQQVSSDDQFVVNNTGTEARLAHPEATVVFKAVGDYSVLSDTAQSVRDSVDGSDQSYRLAVRETWHHAEAEGVVRGVVFDSFTYPSTPFVRHPVDGVGRLVTTKTRRQP